MENKLKQQHALLEQQFEWNDCVVTTDQVTYADMTASAIICCEGAAGFQNPYFQQNYLTQALYVYYSYKANTIFQQLHFLLQD